jgi:hypothetical protein
MNAYAVIRTKFGETGRFIFMGEDVGDPAPKRVSYFLSRAQLFINSSDFVQSRLRKERGGRCGALAL